MSASSSRFPAKISLSFKRQRRQMLDIREELRVQHKQRIPEQDESDSETRVVGPAVGLSLYYLLSHPEQQDDRTESDIDDSIPDFDGFDSQDVANVRRLEQDSYPVSPIRDPVSTATAVMMAKTAIARSKTKSSASSPVQVPSKKHQRLKVLSGVASMSPSSLSPNQSMSPSSQIPSNGASKVTTLHHLHPVSSPAVVTSDDHEAKEEPNSTDDQEKEAVSHADDDDVVVLLSDQKKSESTTASVPSQESSEGPAVPVKRKRGRPPKVRPATDGPSSVHPPSTPRPVPQRISRRSMERRMMSHHSLPSHHHHHEEEKDHETTNGGESAATVTGIRDETTSEQPLDSHADHVSSSPCDLQSHQPVISQEDNNKTINSECNTDAVLEQKNCAATSRLEEKTDDDEDEDTTTRSQSTSHAEKKRKKALISQALQSLQNKWKERMMRTGMMTGSPALPESPASGSSSRVPGGILREARLQVDESTMNKIRSRRDDESDRSSSCGESVVLEGEEEEEENQDNASSSSSPNKRKNRKRIAGRKTSPSKDEVTPRTKSPKKKNPGTIECEICCVVKHYSHKQRRHGVFACETCAKFFSHFMRNRQAYYCPFTGDCCILDPTSRCRACWLKICLQKFDISSEDRDELTINNFLPKLKSEPHVSLIAVDTSNGSGTRFDAMMMPAPMMAVGGTTTAAAAATAVAVVPNGDLVPSVKKRGPGRPRKHPLPPATPAPAASSSTGLLMLAPVTSDTTTSAGVVVVPNSRSVRGPRVKTVCRSTATGLPRATFSPKNINQLMSREPEEEDESCRRSCDSEDSDAIPVTEYIIMNHKRELRAERLAAGLEVEDEEEDEDADNDAETGDDGTAKENTSSSVRKKRSSPKDQKKHRKKKRKIEEQPESGSPEVAKKKKRKNSPTPDAGPKKRGPKPGSHRNTTVGKNSTSSSSPSKKNSQHLVNPPKKVIKKRCGTCEGCTRDDCGECSMCRDKKRFGGPGLIKQACRLRKCAALGPNSRAKLTTVTPSSSPPPAGADAPPLTPV